MTDYIVADDGLPARKSQAYAREKLYYVGRYQKIFAKGMKFKWPERIYYDLMAGPGRCRIEGTGEEFDGSPLLALEAEFTTRVFVESHETLAAALRLRAPTGCRVIQADCNASSTIAELRAAVPAHGALGLAFVDNLGLNVPMSTLRDLTRGRNIDLMIVIQVQDLTRNILDVLSGQDDRGRLDEFFGTAAWHARATDAKRDNLTPSEIANALLPIYEQQLGRVGYRYVEAARKVMKNSRNAAQYRLILAGKSPKATEFFRKIGAIDPAGQRYLDL